MTKASSNHQAHKDLIKTLSTSLARIHRMLLENEIEQLEKERGMTFNPAGRLQLLLNDPNLDWLRVMSQLIAFVDEILFQKEPVTDEQMAAIRVGIDDLIITQKNSQFAEKYRVLCGQIPDLILEHGHLRSAFKQIQSK